MPTPDRATPDRAADSDRAVPATAGTRAEHRLLLASTPPAPPGLRAHPSERRALTRLVQDRVLTLTRHDTHARTSTHLPEVHRGAIRLFDRGILMLAAHTATEAAWVFNGLDGESAALRLRRHQGPGFLPYNLGARGLTPATMSAPELAALLAWHFRHASVDYLDLQAVGRDRVRLVGHRRDETDSPLEPGPESEVAALADVPDFATHTRSIAVGVEDPEARFAPEVLAALVTNLTLRAGRARFGAPRLSVDLHTWRLHPHGHRAETFTDTLPLDTQDALALFAAPSFATAAAFTDWARQHLRVTVRCRTSEEPNHRDRGLPHTLRLDPETGTTVSVPPADPAARQAQEALHLLAALAPDADPPRCLLVQQAWANRGLLRPTRHVRWSDLQADRVLAAHRIAQTVQTLT